MAEDKTKKQEKELDILEEVKRVEKLTKAQLLRKTISKIKKYAKEILELKEQTQIALEEIGLNSTDIKRVIDFVNSLPDVQLTEGEKRSLREDEKEEIVEKREEIQKEIDKKGIDIWTKSLALNTVDASNYTYATNWGGGGASGEAVDMFYSSPNVIAGGNGLTLCNGTASLSVKL